MAFRVLDTNIVSYLMKGHPLAEQYRPHLDGHTLAISFVTVAELYEGAFRARWGKRKWAVLEAAIRRYVVVPSSRELCLGWGRLRYERRNQPIASNDAWIAATALVHHVPLVTHDRSDFAGIEGLTVISAPA